MILNQFRLYRPPESLRKWLFPSLTWARPSGNNTIYLTFDDGPIPALTPFILDVLKDYCAKATFFCVGDNIQKHTKIFERILIEGHSVGNHTFNHLRGWSTRHAVYVENVQKCQTYINQYTSQKPLFRPPYGMITQKQIRTLLKDYEIVMWDVLTYDYSSRISPEICLQKTIQYTKDGSIVVFHDNIKAKNNVVYALPGVLEYFSKKSYLFNGLASS
ncbi:MAG: polysaccharide deacetylase family protein [Cytophagales bacterium]|nr:polysaccharide deacetylase family protein [Cytophagales bacterium]MDW8384138.1 polysaccharide deacetylase family protein [Flammeovirgaceae bacterium]